MYTLQLLKVGRHKRYKIADDFEKPVSLRESWWRSTIKVSKNVYVCTYVCTYIICMHAYILTYTHAYTYINAHTHTQVYIYV